jgi:dihydroorotate dehydrogenase electron transfer subunit
VSLEARMACGMGACLTCVIRGASGRNLRVCKEGPVFDAEEVDWEALDGQA